MTWAVEVRSTPLTENVPGHPIRVVGVPDSNVDEQIRDPAEAEDLERFGKVIELVQSGLNGIV
jgi:hypothetical protein